MNSLVDGNAVVPVHSTVPVNSPDVLHPVNAARLFDAQAIVDINWERLIDRRPVALKQHPELPKYLLLPEIESVLAATLDDSHYLMLDVLWHTGARVSEMLALTPEHFDFQYEEVSLETLKQKKVGRPKKVNARALQRVVPTPDPEFLERVKRFIVTHRPGQKDRLFPVTPQTVQNRIDKWTADLELPFRPTPHTFRHSFAVNQILHFVPVNIVQAWLGHKNIESTVIYTKVLNTETGHFMRHVQYRRQTLGAPATPALEDAQ
ncbi:MAG: tyrosine-type recombinase/integrase [Pseudomonadota bacterium]